MTSHEFTRCDQATSPSAAPGPRIWCVLGVLRADRVAQGDDEASKPFGLFIEAGCNLWRNWHDIQCSFSSVLSIVDHWGNYSAALASAAGPGHWNDPDMLIVGNDCVSPDEAQTQFAIWSIVAAPLIMGNDLRNVTDAGRQILLNEEAIAIDQDPLGRPGGRISPYGTTEVWARPLSGGDLAVVLLNKNINQTTMTLDMGQLNLTSAEAVVHNIYERRTVGVISRARSMPFAVPPHGCAFLRLRPMSPGGRSMSFP